MTSGIQSANAPLTGLRVALFSGNYNYVRDGANQALNRLVGYLLRQGASVRIYSPTVENPAFPPTGDLISVPSVGLPMGRGEYRFSLGLSKAIRKDLAEFDPMIVHVSAPDVLGHRAVSWARKKGLPILASVHTRFETYPRYYKMAWLEPTIEAMLRRFYLRCDALVAPSDSFIEILRQQGMNTDISLWTRGVDRTIFNADRRDMAWRQSLGIKDTDVVIGFLGRLVMEKGLDVFSDSLRALQERGVPHKALIIGEGPAHNWLKERLPDAIFGGFQTGENLGRAVASLDIFFNPSITETFGNVSLEAMACAVPIVAASAAGSNSLVSNGLNGTVVPPGDTSLFANALQNYIENPALRLEHGKAGEQRSLNYAWDAINQAVADTYLRLVEGSKRH